MSEIMIMKENIIKVYGKDSEEAKYAQYIFSRRSTEYFKEIYHELMGKIK